MNIPCFLHRYIPYYTNLTYSSYTPLNAIFYPPRSSVCIPT